jgi:FkbM family methyltransferase
MACPLLLEDASVEVRDVGRFQLRKRSDDLYHVLPTREFAIFRAIESALADGGCFVDAGANIGFYTVLAAKRVGAEGKVIAIEMMPDTAAILRQHVRLNRLDNVEIVEKALSDRDGSQITAHVPEGKYGQASIAGLARGRAVTVETATLDAVLKDTPSISLMKMDLEGAEELALKGALQCLARTDAVIFESWASEAAVGDMLVEQGFVIWRLDGRNFIGIRK